MIGERIDSRLPVRVDAGEFGMAPVRVLLVDDDADLRHAIRASLERARSSIRIVEASSAEEALETARDLLARGEPVDVVLTDFRMGHMTGLELLQILSREAPNTRRILMSGDAVAEDLSRGDGSVTAFLAKPFAPTPLLDLVPT